MIKRFTFSQHPTCCSVSGCQEAKCICKCSHIRKKCLVFFPAVFECVLFTCPFVISIIITPQWKNFLNCASTMRVYNCFITRYHTHIIMCEAAEGRIQESGMNFKQYQKCLILVLHTLFEILW